MIFVTTGSMFPFDRLTKAVDEWAQENVLQDVLIQIGTGEYEPLQARWVRMMRPLEFSESINTCNLVVAHLGMGSIITAMQAQKPIILFPRQFALGEHTSDHQLHGTDWLKDRPGIFIADDVANLHRLLNDFVRGEIGQPTDKAANYASPKLIENLRRFIFNNAPK